ncbi:MAG TPA: SDR family oxidoreductase, partial [Rhodanobacteraceae bacterium]|nr:SDR family oxidoreductase [Rhodanobacteraceae bacterium]
MKPRLVIGTTALRRYLMKIVVIGGTGLIGSRTVARLRRQGHDAIAAAPNTGVNTITGEGLDAAMVGTDVVVDLANAPSWEEPAVLDFFETSGRNLFAAEKKAGVKYHVALSVVGADHLTAIPYMRGKILQENLIRASSVPYTIIHSTQFFEFLNGIASDGAGDKEIRLSTGLIQPIAADDVADAVAHYALAPAINGMVEIGGPDKFPLAELVRMFLELIGDKRKVIGDPDA